MKRPVKFLLLACLILLAFALSACSNKSDDDSGTKPNDSISDNRNQAYCKHDNPSEIAIVKAETPTCQKTGLTEGMVCNLCGVMVKPQRVIETIKCIESDWIVQKEATHTEDGIACIKCTMCAKILKQDTILSGNKKLKYTKINNETYSVTGIGACNDNDIVIPSHYNGLPVTAIGKSAFEGLSALTSITIPNSVTSIGDSAFSECTALATVAIPNSVISIGDDAFLRCYALTNIAIPNSVTSIGDFAFYFCTSLSRVTIGSKVTSIGKSAFYGCSKITNIKIPDSVTSIGLGAFGACTNLVNISVDGNNEYYKSIDGNLYNKDCTSLISYAIGKNNSFFAVPDSVTVIYDYAFYFCENLRSITVSNNVISIGKSAFMQCANLQSVTIPESVTKISTHMFYLCSSLTTISFGGTVGQWSVIKKGTDWDIYTASYVIYCTDGQIAKNGTVTYD